MIVYDGNKLIAKMGDLNIARVNTDDNSTSLSHHRICDSEDWRVSEQLRDENETSRANMFNLGCLYLLHSESV